MIIVFIMSIGYDAPETPPAAHRDGSHDATGPSTTDPKAAEVVFLSADLSLLEPLTLATGDMIADVGPGTGAVTVALARLAGSQGRVYAVDHDRSMLEAVSRSVRDAGVADRVRLVHHDLDDGPPNLPESVSAVWSAACVHHTSNWQETVTGLAGLLRPGGVLALAEGGLPMRCLPWDTGTGRPGLEIRLDEAHNRWFADWFGRRPGQVRETRGWVDLLAGAGLVDIGSRSALLDVPAPLVDDVRGVVLAEFAARVRRARPFLDADDAAAWSRLLDHTDPVWAGHRTDLALLTARTVHWGRTRADR